ncbi:adenylate/guanylate cyclase domain-containing protein [Neorhizobium galegae]|uniref:adenylate/guanylate cyclase domain-containing protein n=1 Tax=Neorhizobium galegae TaxID=399 RepID=UPI0021066E2F|nr:adenylate/guanylate cyclase domain-containing protein [Neorhizobium galegae]MCQ1774488.1 adenylate/guanylate cyclase domain-containing protein [Neorhizobium galegae]
MSQPLMPLLVATQLAARKPSTGLHSSSDTPMHMVSKFPQPRSDNVLEIRIGINSGRVVAGVIGNQKFAYALWGDPVNVAARLEETELPGGIQVTNDFANLLRGRFVFEPRGGIPIKGKGVIGTNFLLREKSKMVFAPSA